MRYTALGDPNGDAVTQPNRLFIERVFVFSVDKSTVAG